MAGKSDRRRSAIVRCTLHKNGKRYSDKTWESKDVAETTKLDTEPRTNLGTKASKALRKLGKLPGIIYGHNETPVAVSLDEHFVEVALAQGARIFDVIVAGKTERCLIKDVQWDTFGQTPIHIDLARVDIDERVTVNVGIELRGVPKGIADGGVLDQHMASIEVECLATEIPDTLAPFVTDLGIGDSLLVKDLPLAEGVVPQADPEDRVATVNVLAIAVEEEEEEVVDTGEEAGGEPERIGRVRKDEEGAAGS